MRRVAKLEKWVAKLVGDAVAKLIARLLATAVLWVEWSNPDVSQSIKWAT